MKKNPFTIPALKRPVSSGLFLPSFVILLSASCAIPTPPDNRKRSGVAPWSPEKSADAAFDFKKHCGVDPESTAKSEYFSQSMKSMTFTINADVVAIKAYIEADATLKISSTPEGTTEVIGVNINKAFNQATDATLLSGLVTTIGAKIVANGKRGTLIYKPLPRGEWLKLTGGSNPGYKGLLCVATGSKSMNSDDDRGKTFTFAPALLGSVNPMASPEQFKIELGNGRVFQTVATLTDDSSGRVIESAPGTIKYTPVSPVFEATDPVSKKIVKISADDAWEVISDFPTLSQRNDKLTSKLTFYISHKEKKFMAIVQEDVRPSGSGISMPPVILLPE